MEFSPGNPIIKFCVQGMEMEQEGNSEKALNLFLRAWNESTNDFEKYVSAYFIARNQGNVQDKLNWLKTALDLGLSVNDITVRSALPTLYSEIAQCYEELGNTEEARKNLDLAHYHKNKPADQGPFYHGTKADLKIGDLLIPGSRSNYNSEVIMNHIYFTALVNGAGFAAALVKGEGRERVYIVEPTGNFENDPNVTNKKFPGNPTRSYRSQEPLKIVGEVTNWIRLNPADIQKIRDRLENVKGDIIN